ncbi:MAG: (Fe-S)-binding protein [candidate division KSB1 bacterium]|nr:(Fe-S)-binding protein [candidate division KSB1 bacterium]MDZ7336092.1 (Fe-S)-binding protein [candidate division KSB1 bacterium]MDZ7358418.1 (Fe-S)-binding protein [candidate division KSB1 bacterium]
MDRTWQEAYEEAIRCIRCGYCQPTCPTYVVTGIEHSVARGRNFLARLIYEGEVAFDPQYKTPIFECLLCGACNVNCAPVVKTQDIMMAAREIYIQRHGQPPLQRFVFRELLPNPERMTRLMKLIALGKRTGISGLAQALRVFGWIAKDFANAEALVASFPKKFFRERLSELPSVRADRGPKIGYFVGCGINYAFPDVGMATVELLIKNRYAVEVLNNLCCGLPAVGYGDRMAAKAMAKRNVEIIEQSGCDIIISECGSCSSFLSEYGKLLSEEPDWSDRAKRASKKIMDVNLFLSQFPLDSDFTSTEDMIVTYHDPCHLERYQKIKTQPRDLIRRIAGVHYVELPEANWCCGGAGTYNLSHYEMSMKILQRKMNNVRTTEANILLSSCPGCLVQLAYGARKFKLPVRVMHLVQLLNQTIIR